MRSAIDYLEEELRDLAVKEIRGKKNVSWIPLTVAGFWILLQVSGIRWFPGYQALANSVVAIVIALFIMAFQNLWRSRPIGEQRIKEKMEELKQPFLKRKLAEIEDEITKSRELREDIQDDIDDLEFDRRYVEEMIEK